MNQSHKTSSPSSYRLPREQSKLRRYFIVLNPGSGSASLDAVRQYAELKAELSNKSVDFHVLKKGDDLGTILQNAVDDGMDVLVAAGGDGTLASVATEAWRLQKVFGVIPCGTANVFAAEHFIPKKIEEAIDLLMEARATEAVDVLRVGEKVFLCHISIGTYSWITTQTPASAKKRFGRLAYIWNTFKIMLQERIWTFELEIDGKSLVRRASTIMVANAGSLGASGLRWGENISTSDGVVEVCIFRARTFRHYVALFWAFLTRKPQHPLKEYLYVKQQGVIRGPDNLPIRADGELIGQGTFQFQVQPQALEVLMTRRKVPSSSASH